MIKLINPNTAEGIIERYDAWIGQVAERYQVPAALIKAILYQEMTKIDLMDPIAATSQRWTDVDRFVNAPLEYVIMFEKQ